MPPSDPIHTKHFGSAADMACGAEQATSHILGVALTGCIFQQARMYAAFVVALLKDPLVGIPR
jgi:hypothetical protein